MANIHHHVTLKRAVGGDGLVQGADRRATEHADQWPTALPTMETPNIRGMSQKDAEKLPAQVGLGLGEQAASCEEIGVAEELRVEARKGRVACQSVEPGSSVPKGSLVTYMLSNGKD